MKKIYFLNVIIVFFLILQNQLNAMSDVDLGMRFLTAIEQNNVEEFKKCLNQKPEAICIRFQFNYSLLHMAAMFGRLVIVKFLLSVWEFDVNDKADDGYTSLHVAAAYGQFEVVKMLCAKYANISAKTKQSQATPKDLIMPSRDPNRIEIASYLTTLEDAINRFSGKKGKK